MIEQNKEIKPKLSAQIIVEGKPKIRYRRGELEKLVKELEEIKDSEVIKDLEEMNDLEEIKKATSQKIEAIMLLSCLLTGRSVILTGGEILLFMDKEQRGKIGPNWIIKENPKLYEMVAELMIS